MRTSTKLYILVFAIIFAVILPPILCYIFIVRPADHTAGQDTSTNTGNEHTSTEGLDTTDAAKSFTILIDPGHGGFDPGKVGHRLKTGIGTYGSGIFRVSDQRLRQVPEQ